MRNSLASPAPDGADTLAHYEPTAAERAEITRRTPLIEARLEQLDNAQRRTGHRDELAERRQRRARRQIAAYWIARIDVLALRTAPLAPAGGVA